MANESKPSKYLRNGKKPVSKYDATNKKASKYIKSDSRKAEEVPETTTDETEEKKDTYRKNVITPKRARELALEEERLAKQAAEETEKAARIAAGEIAEETPENTPADENTTVFVENDETEEDVTHKGTATDMFKGEVNEAEQEITYGLESAEVSSKNVRGRATVRMLICIAILTAAACGLQFFQFHIPFIARLFSVEFSALPELITAIAYGPLAGIGLCLVKNVVHVIVTQESAVSALTNFLLNTVFLFFASAVYSRLMLARDKNAIKKNKPVAKSYSAIRAFIGSVIGAVISLIPQFFVTRYISYPLMEKLFAKRGITSAAILGYYQVSLQNIREYTAAHYSQSIAKMVPEIASISQGIVAINLPITLGKLLAVSLLAAVLMKLLMPFLLFETKKSKEG